jgi:hypothetical protein
MTAEPQIPLLGRRLAVLNTVEQLQKLEGYLLSILGHLRKSERTVIEPILRRFRHVFHDETDSIFEGTDLVEHRIITGDAAPIRKAPYRHAYYWATAELRDPNISWQDFKSNFLKRFGDVRSDQYHYYELHLARQRIHETPRKFLDKVRMVSSRSIL